MGDWTLVEALLICLLDTGDILDRFGVFEPLGVASLVRLRAGVTAWGRGVHNWSAHFSRQGETSGSFATHFHTID